MAGLRVPAKGIRTMTPEQFWSFFYEIYETLPRQGPGDRASTERALGLLPPLSRNQRILDIGCGAGAQTLDLARATEARIVAVDNHPAFVATLSTNVAALGLGERITAQVGDMHDLPFPDASFDVLWSEGAIFVIGFSRGLTEWRRLLKPGGHLVVSEFCWFQDDPPAELVELHFDGAPAAGNVEARREAIAKSEYRLVGEFVLPEVVWWESYYAPLGEELVRFRDRHAQDPEALEVAARCQQEIDLAHKYPGVYGYVYFVLQQGDA